MFQCVNTATASIGPRKPRSGAGALAALATVALAWILLLAPGAARSEPGAPDASFADVRDNAPADCPCPPPRPLRWIPAARTRVARAEAPPPPRAAEVLRWNALLLDGIRVNRAFPPTATRNLAIAHAAVFDALNSLTPRYEPCVALLTADPAASPDIAVAAAANAVARVLFPAQTTQWDAALSDTLSAATASASSRAAGLALGRAAAAAALENRRGDGASAMIAYAPGTQPGQWRPTRPDFTPALQPHWGTVRPFVIQSAQAYMPPPPPPLDSAEWAADYNEVKLRGEVFFSNRTAEETSIAYFWSDPSGSVSPPGHWNLIAAIFIERENLEPLAAARAFALLNLAEADAAIVCWKSKYDHNFWRPITAINLGDTDGNPATELDEFWTPLLLTPRFPDYLSGHSTFSGAAAEVLGQLFGREVPFAASSDELLENYGLPDFTRQFHSFEHAAHEASESRILGGIHFRTACENGLATGRAIGATVATRALQPLTRSIWVAW